MNSLLPGGIFPIFLFRKASAAEIRGNNKHGRMGGICDVRRLLTDNLLKDEKRIFEQQEKFHPKLRRMNRKKISGDSESGYSSNRDSASENIDSACNLSSG